MPGNQGVAIRNLSRLLMLASPMLPVGAYSYSQGLEWAIECGDVKDLPTAKDWIGDVLASYQANYELPMLIRLHDAWQSNDLRKVADWDEAYQAGKDTAETQAETLQMGYSLRKLMQDLGEFPIDFVEDMAGIETPAFATIYAGVCVAWGIPVNEMLHTYAWSWAENQVSAAMKTVPLGQVAGQKILLHLGKELPGIVAHSMRVKDEEISNFCPALTIASCQHETQYTRLFRS